MKSEPEHSVMSSESSPEAAAVDAELQGRVTTVTKAELILISPLEMAQIVAAFRARSGAEQAVRPRQFGKPPMPICPPCQRRPSTAMLHQELHEPTVVTFEPCGHKVAARVEAIGEAEARAAAKYVLRHGAVGTTLYGQPD